jgi:hypothetical protein
MKEIMKSKLTSAFSISILVITGNTEKQTTQKDTEHRPTDNIEKQTTQKNRQRRKKTPRKTDKSKDRQTDKIKTTESIYKISLTSVLM